MRFLRRNHLSIVLGALAVLFAGYLAEAVKTQIVDLGTTGTAPNDTVSIWRDASHNLSLKDPNAGTVVLNDIQTAGYWALSGSDAVLSPNRDIDMQSTATITNLPTPSAGGDAANKDYVDAHLAVSGGTYIADGATSDTKIDTDTAGDGSANTIIMKNAGVTSLFIGATGKGVIGQPTPVPASRFHVYDNSSAVDATVGLTVEQDGTGDALVHWLLTGDRRWVLGIDNSDFNKFKVATNAIGAGVGLTTSVLTIDTDGNVGIGDTAPDVELDVTGDVQITKSLYVNLNEGLNYFVVQGETAVPLLHVEGGIDRIGIATAYPEERLDMDGVLMLRDADAPSTTAAAVKLWSSSGELMAMDDAGNSTTLTSHVGDEWTYKSFSAHTGKHVEIDMERAMIALDEWYRQEHPGAESFVRRTYHDGSE